MKRWNLFVGAMTMLCIQLAQAQNDLCNTVVDIDPYFEGIFATQNQNVTMESFATAEPYVLKIHFWDVAFDNGDNPDALSLEQMLGVVANLNKDFNAFNIFFKFDGKSQVNASNFRVINTDPDMPTGNPTPGEFINYLEQSSNYKTGTINMYSIDDLLFSGAYQDDQNDGLFGIIVTDHSLYSTTYPSPILLTHEVGHFFNLQHTFYCGADDNSCENVTRDPNDPDYNAHNKGDYIIDTFATPEGMQGDVDFDSNTCLYTNTTATDETGRPYADYEPEVTNFMSYSWPCQSQFTPGQVVRMRLHIDVLNDHPTITKIENHDISTLYEPYAGFYAPYFPYLGNEPPLFQPGFTYRFVACECECPQPTDYEDTNFSYTNTSLLTIFPDETDYSRIAHPNHSAISIAEVPEMLGDPQTVRRCWDNWFTPPIIGGTITLFNDGVFNTNVTIVPQDSTQINNPALVDDLDSGLYNIKKNKADGTIDEVNILKENE
ncbi:MAG: hypothetical protein Aureis2KO_02780 [Aureisphaera sp.]